MAKDEFGNGSHHVLLYYEAIGDGLAARVCQASTESEVIEALTVLGYSATEARRAVNDLDKSPELIVEDRIRLAMQRNLGEPHHLDSDIKRTLKIIRHSSNCLA